MTQAYDALTAYLVKSRTWGGISSLVGWDQETYMPPKAAKLRAEQQAVLGELLHTRATSDELASLLVNAEAEAKDASPEAQAMLREARWDFDRATKLPVDFVAELTRVCSHALEAWKSARTDNRFDVFAPHLERILEFKKQEIAFKGFEDDPYDALLEDYEPGAKTSEIAAMLENLRDELVPVVAAIGDSGISTLKTPEPFPTAAQERFGRMVATAMGFDFERGRLDVTTHPFCSGFEPNDVRITTRYDEANPRQALFGTMHEAGHGLYEQGLAAQHFGTPLGSACSLGVHESQSRLWENMIGRSEAFWRHFFPKAQEVFGTAFAGISESDWVRHVNEARPSLIRVEADEATYNLHILLRFEIERALLTGELAVADLPAAWNDKVKTYLGLTPATDAEGVLQDIHWSFGGFGYFPTYSLGNLYAAQMFETMNDELGGINALLERGELLPIREWLRTNVHERGRLLRPVDLMEKITGAKPSAEPFLTYLKGKLDALYGASVG